MTRAVVTAIAIACLTAACRSKPAAAPAPTVSADTWAVVDGRSISRDEVEKAFRRDSDPAQPLSAEEALAAKLSVLDELIVQEILGAKAAGLKIEVMPSELDTAYNEAKQNMPDEAFNQELAKRNLTPNDMREGLRRQMLARKVIEREVTSKVNVTDEEVTSFFNANRAQFNLPEDAYHLAQIVVTTAREPQITNRTGDDATSPQAAAAKVKSLMERLQMGAMFADLARDFSEDPESAPRGGDLGLVPMSALKQAPPALRDAVLKMPVGNARVVNQGNAATIIFVVSKETAGQRELTTPGVKENITNTLKARREQLFRAAYLTAVRNDASVTNYLARRVVDSQGKTSGL